MTQAVWLYRPPTWHPRPRRLLPPSKAVTGTLALDASGYEIGDGNAPGTMAVEAAVDFDVAVYPASQWPLTSATLTLSSQTTSAAGRLADIVSASLTPSTSYRVVLRRVSDGECWTFTMTAT